MIRAWCDQVRLNKPFRDVPRGFRLLHPNGIIEWDGLGWQYHHADQVAILSIGKVRNIE